MNRGLFESSPVQQMIMAGNMNWWNINNTNSPFMPPSSSPSSATASPLFPQYPPTTSLPLGSSLHQSQDMPESWSQLLLGGLVGEEERCTFSEMEAKKMGNWEEQALYSSSSSHMVDVKQESWERSYAYGHGNNEQYQMVKSTTLAQVVPNSSPRSCVTGLNTNMLDFSGKKLDGRHPLPDHSSECNSNANGSAFKKARIQPAAQSTFKVRKEKLGDRITALHQLVSPFGKTDTASVLLEAIGYIRFLQGQIEALSSPYLGSGGSGNRRQPVQGERNCIFPEDPTQDAQDEPKKDLRSRGLCLVPVSCTLQVGSDNGADYWAPAFGGSFQ